MHSSFRSLIAVLPFLIGVVAATHAADDFTRPIKVSPDGRFLAQPDGQPFFFLAENAEYLLWRLDREDTESYLQDRAQKGFTVIIAHVVPRSDMNLPNAYGQSAFLRGNLARPNPKYFEHVDWVIARAAHHGLRFALQPINGIEYVSQGKFNGSNVQAYGRWLGERYGDQGIIWVLGHDATPIWMEWGSWQGPNAFVLKDFRSVYDRMAGALTVASGHDPFITYHPPCCNLRGTAEPRTSLYWARSEWLDMNMLQSGHFEDPAEFVERYGFASGWTATKGYEPIRAEYDSLPTRPIVDGEAHWEDVPRDVIIDKKPGRWDQVDIRNAAYQSVFAGAAGHSYGHVSVYGYVVPGERDATSGFIKYARLHWKEALNAPGARQIGHMKALMLSRPYFTRIPDQSVIIGDSGEGSAHVGATRDRSGSYMMIYLPLGQPVTVDLMKLAGSSAIGWWFDPRTATAKRIEGTFSTSRPQRFTPPSSGHGNDWVLVLDAAEQLFSTPGLVTESDRDASVGRHNP